MDDDQFNSNFLRENLADHNKNLNKVITSPK